MELYVTEPVGWTAVSAAAPGAQVALGALTDATDGNGVRWRRVTITSAAPLVSWSVRFARTP